MWYTVFATTRRTEACEMAHMQHTTKRSLAQLQVWHGLILLSVLGIALSGNPQESQAGWIAVPVCLPGIPCTGGRRPRQGAALLSGRLSGMYGYVRRSWRQPLLRSLLLAGLWLGSGQQGPLVPWLALAGVAMASSGGRLARIDSSGGMAYWRLAAVAGSASYVGRLPGLGGATGRVGSQRGGDFASVRPGLVAGAGLSVV